MSSISLALVGMGTDTEATGGRIDYYMLVRDGWYLAGFRWYGCEYAHRWPKADS